MLKEILTVSLQESKEIQALTESFDTVLSEIFQKIPNVLIYSRIDTLSEEVIDLLAWQFHIEGYELAETEEEKRALVKKAIELHRYKGTRWAIKKVFEVLGINAEIQEWFEYGGEPYKFKVLLKSVVQDEDTYRKLIELINEYKNTRSWLDSIGIHREHTAQLYYGFAAKDGKYYTIGLHVHVDIDKTNVYFAMAQRTAMSTTIGVYNPTIKVDPSSYYIAGAVRQAKHTIIGGVVNG